MPIGEEVNSRLGIYIPPHSLQSKIPTLDEESRGLLCIGAASLVLVPGLEYVPGFLLLAIVGEQALAVVVVLYAGEHAAR